VKVTDDREVKDKEKPAEKSLKHGINPETMPSIEYERFAEELDLPQDDPFVFTIYRYFKDRKEFLKPDIKEFLLHMKK
jgi:hypothetical protein